LTLFQYYVIIITETQGESEMIHPTTLGNCPTCSKPLSGRGKCRSYAHVAIGPRKVGDITTNWTGNRAEILAINSGSDNANIGENWSIVERDIDGDMPGRIRHHFTAWDPKRSKIVGHV